MSRNWDLEAARRQLRKLGLLAEYDELVRTGKCVRCHAPSDQLCGAYCFDCFSKKEHESQRDELGMSFTRQPPDRHWKGRRDKAVGR